MDALFYNELLHGVNRNFSMDMECMELLDVRIDGDPTWISWIWTSSLSDRLQSGKVKNLSVDIELFINDEADVSSHLPDNSEQLFIECYSVDPSALEEAGVHLHHTDPQHFQQLRRVVVRYEHLHGGEWANLFKTLERALEGDRHIELDTVFRGQSTP